MNEDMELTAAAKTWLNLMWRSIEDKIRATVGHHHWIHEPGGPDQIVLPVSALADVNAPSPSDGDALVYNATDKLWEPGAVTGGAGSNSAFFEVITLGEIPSLVPPGPANISGSTRTIDRILVSSDGQCTGTVAGEAFSIDTGGGTDDLTDLAVSWADAAELAAAISTVGEDCNYINATVHFE